MTHIYYPAAAASSEWDQLPKQAASLQADREDIEDW